MARHQQRRQRPPSRGKKPPSLRLKRPDATRKVQTYTNAVAAESALHFDENGVLVAQMHVTNGKGKSRPTSNFAYMLHGHQGSWDGPTRDVCLITDFSGGWDLVIQTLDITEAILGVPNAIVALSSVRDAIDGRINQLREEAGNGDTTER